MIYIPSRRGELLANKSRHPANGNYIRAGRRESRGRDDWTSSSFDWTLTDTNDISAAFTVTSIGYIF
jgi:hypothetical protein